MTCSGSHAPGRCSASPVVVQPGIEQMRRHRTSRSLPQIAREVLRVGVHGGLAGVVGRVPGADWLGPCFEPVLTITAGRAAASILGKKRLHAVHDAQDVDGEQSLPVFDRVEDATCPTGNKRCRVVHEQCRRGRILSQPRRPNAVIASIEATSTTRAMHVRFTDHRQPTQMCGRIKLGCVHVDQDDLHSCRPQRDVPAARPMPLAPPVMTATPSLLNA